VSHHPSPVQHLLPREEAEALRLRAALARSGGEPWSAHLLRRAVFAVLMLAFALLMHAWMNAAAAA
jgi:hypothetical protein